MLPVSGAEQFEGLGAEMRLAHLLGEIGIFDRGQAVAALRARQPRNSTARAPRALAFSPSRISVWRAV